MRFWLFCRKTKARTCNMYCHMLHDIIDRTKAVQTYLSTTCLLGNNIFINHLPVWYTSAAVAYAKGGHLVKLILTQVLYVQGEAVRSVLETSLSTLPFPPTLESILRCWLSAVESVEKVFSSLHHSASQTSLQTPGFGQLGTFSQPCSFPMQGLLPTSTPAVISIGSLAPLSNPAVAPVGNGFSSFGASAATAGPSFSTLPATSSATAATFGGSGIPQIPTARNRSLQKQLSTGTMPSHAMLASMQPGMATGSVLPTGTAPVSYSASHAVSNPMGSIASLVSAGLLPQGSASSAPALPQASLGHLAALLDLPRSSAHGAASHLQASGLQ